MTSDEYRAKWAIADRRMVDETMARVRRFVVFVAGMTILSAAIGAALR